MADVELVVLLLVGLGAVLGLVTFPAIRLPVSWLASIVLVRLALVVPQALPVLSWQPWFLAVAIIGLVGALVTSLVMWYRWVLQGKFLTVPPGTPPLMHVVFLPGFVICVMSTGNLPVPITLWIEIPLALNATLMSVLLLVLILKSVRQAQHAQKQSGADSAS